MNDHSLCDHEPSGWVPLFLVAHLLKFVQKKEKRNTEYILDLLFP